MIGSCDPVTDERIDVRREILYRVAPLACANATECI